MLFWHGKDIELTAHRKEQQARQRHCDLQGFLNAEDKKPYVGGCFITGGKLRR